MATVKVNVLSNSTLIWPDKSITSYGAGVRSVPVKTAERLIESGFAEAVRQDATLAPPSDMVPVVLANGVKGSNITSPSGGLIIDAESRAAIDSILSILEDFNMINSA